MRSIMNGWSLWGSLPKQFYLRSLKKTYMALSEKEEKILDELIAFKFYPMQVAPGVTLGKDNLFKKTL